MNWPRLSSFVLLALAFLLTSAPAENHRPAIIYGWPGSSDSQKSYLGFGGAFSPVPGSFGLWLENANRIPVQQIERRFEWPRDNQLPVVVTITPDYREVLWSDLPGHWLISAGSPRKLPLRLIIRGDGPAGGQIQKLENRYGRLFINERWIVKFDPAATAVAIKNERADVTIQPLTTIETTDLKFGRVPALPYGSTKAVRDFHFTDARFAACLNAQVAQLMMSLAGHETRAADLVKDGAYVVVALAHAGHVDAAKWLCSYFAEHDAAADADGTGLSLWALGQTSRVAHDPAFDARILPAVRRKADEIVNAQGSKNAIGYLGLTEALALEERMPGSSEMPAWKREAERLHSAWQPTATASALWPSTIGETAKPRSGELMERRWNSAKVHTDLVEAHTWLTLGRRDRAEQTVRWYLDHQAMPGLYVWEDKGIAAQMALLLMDLAGGGR